MTIRGYEPGDLAAMREIWNAVVEAGDAFPQTEPLADDAQARTFFGGQTHTAVAADGEGIAGLYILHPNNIGRCGHIANASFAVRPGARGRGMGEALVRDCMARGAEYGFRILQFNAVVASNSSAIRLYERLGFRRLGRVEGGFRRPDGTYADILLLYIPLT